MGKNFCQIGCKWCKFLRRGVCNFSQTPTELLAKCPRISNIETVNLSTLLHTVTFEDVFERLIHYFPDEIRSRNGYQSVFNYLLLLQPKPLTNLNDLFIDIQMFGTSLDVSGISVFKNNNVSYGIEFTPWEDWVSMNITQDSLNNFSSEDIVAGCLYEMTFFGFQEEMIQDTLKKMQSNIEECKKQIEAK